MPNGFDNSQVSAPSRMRTCRPGAVWLLASHELGTKLLDELHPALGTNSP